MADTYLVYYDETGDDGLVKTSCDHFVLTCIYMPIDKWQENYNALRNMRKYLREKFELHIADEFHTKHFLTDKNPYRQYKWSKEVKQEILKKYTVTLANADIQCINVIIDKTIIQKDTYPVLENALTYSIQRVENDSAGKWKYVIISDKGRIGAMVRVARKIRVYNPIGYQNKPIRNMVEDVLEKDSSESYFIQSCDFISYFAHLYFVTQHQGKQLPNRIANVIDPDFVNSVFQTLKKGNVLNLKSHSSHPYGFVIYPK